MRWLGLKAFTTLNKTIKPKSHLTLSFQRKYTTPPHAPADSEASFSIHEALNKICERLAKLEGEKTSWGNVLSICLIFSGIVSFFVRYSYEETNKRIDKVDQDVKALRTEMQAGFSEIRGYFVNPKKPTRKTSTNNKAQMPNTANGAVNIDTAHSLPRPR